MYSHLFSTNYIFIFPRKLKLSKILANLQFIKRVRLFIDINEEKSREMLILEWIGSMIIRLQSRIPPSGWLLHLLRAGIEILKNYGCNYE